MQFGMMDHMMTGSYFGMSAGGTLTLIIIIFGILLLYINYQILTELKALKDTMEKVKELLSSIQ